MSELSGIALKSRHRAPAQKNSRDSEMLQEKPAHAYELLHRSKEANPAHMRATIMDAIPNSLSNRDPTNAAKETNPRGTAQEWTKEASHRRTWAYSSPSGAPGLS